MVDVTRIDKITKTDKASNQKPYYSDFFTNFNVHPQNKRLVKYTNEESVKRSIRNLINTEKYDRLFQPEVGCRIRSFLFENMSEIVSNEIKSSIKETIEIYEPRARIVDIIVQANEARHAYDVYIYFQVINSDKELSINITLYRAR